MEFLSLFLLILSVLSHIGMSLFLAKPKFSKPVTALIWLLYAVVFLILPPDTAQLNYALMLVLNGVLFFASTKGKPAEKGFLFLSYACIYTSFGVLVSFVGEQEISFGVQIMVSILIMALLQFLLYALILPQFRKVSPYIDRGWGKYYAIVVAFLIVTAVQSIYLDGVTRTDNGRFQIFLLTTAVFYITYAAVFASLKDMVELAKERRKQIHMELLTSQVEAQAHEVELAHRSRHDVRHHNDMVLTMAKAGDLSGIIAYLEKQTEQLSAAQPMRYCENETVNNILCLYRAKAEQAGIRFSATAAVKKDAAISPADLVTVLANVVENALHGAQNAEQDEAMISADIYYKARKLVIVCENSCAPSLDFPNDMPEELRGIGIRSICATAERYGGSGRFTAKGGLFRCTVVLSA